MGSCATELAVRPAIRSTPVCSPWILALCCFCGWANSGEISQDGAEIQEGDNIQILDALLRDYDSIRELDPDSLGKWKAKLAVILSAKSKFVALAHSDKLRVLDLVANLGVSLSAQADRRPWEAYVSDPSVIGFFVDGLSSSSREVRDRCSFLLAKRTASNALVSFGDRIAVLLKSNSASYEVELLGKAGCESARNILLSDSRYKKNLRPFELALSRLGDRNLELKFAKEFVEEPNGVAKAEKARELGYLGTPCAIQYLVCEIRNPMLFSVNSRQKSSIRVPIIQALSHIMPDVEVMWRPNDPDKLGDKYYIDIEDWLTLHLRARWKEERPAFFWEQGSPIPVPGVRNSGVKEIK